MRSISRLTSMVSFCLSESVSQSKFSTPLFKRKRQQKHEPSSFEHQKHTSKQQLQGIVNRINQSNQYFMGVKLNTNYLKVNRSVTLASILQQKVNNITITQLPIEIAKQPKDLQHFDRFQENLSSKAADIAFQRCSKQKLILHLQPLLQKYVLSLGSQGRFTHLEPNFQRHNIKLINSLKQRFLIKINAQQCVPQIKIKGITLLKGMQVLRNNNYSTDSYSKDETEAKDGIITYTLFKQKRQMYPEPEWLSTQMINARIQLLVKDGPFLQVFQNGQFLGSSKNCVHNVVVESNMLVPPLLSLQKLTGQQFLRSYRLNYRDLILTDFDRKNGFYGLTYSEAEKKSTLINSIE